MKYCQKIYIQEPQGNRNATANFVNLIRTSTVVGHSFVFRIRANEQLVFEI